MSDWNHAICDPCWLRRCEALGQVGRVPTRVVSAPSEGCCFCGRATESGIYVREEPGTPPYCRHHADPP